MTQHRKLMLQVGRPMNCGFYSTKASCTRPVRCSQRHGKFIDCIIDSMRHHDRSNAAAAKYANVCVDLATAEKVHVLDLHTYFNTAFPEENVRKTFFADGLHFSEKGNKEVGKLLGIAINGMFDKKELDKFNKWQLPDWQDLATSCTITKERASVS